MKSRVTEKPFYMQKMIRNHMCRFILSRFYFSNKAEILITAKGGGYTSIILTADECEDIARALLYKAADIRAYPEKFELE